MSMKIVTGATGSAHVTSNNDREFNQGLWGSGNYILKLGGQLAYTIVDNNTITIADGDVIIQGCHGLIEPGTTENVTIETGEVGKNRIDLIVIKYELDSSTGFESMGLKVIKGTATTGTPAVPSYASGDIRTGAKLVEVPLYEVTITGINITDVKKKLDIKDSLYNQISSLDANAQTMATLLNGLSAGGKITAVQIVDDDHPMPSNPVSTTLYLVKG